jgi:hypothetical protein
VKASTIITEIGRQLNDAAQTRWPLADLYVYLTEASRQLVLIQPRANPAVKSVQLTPLNTLQNLPDDSSSLIDITRNMGADGSTPGQVITVADRQALDGLNANWHSAAGSTVIDNYTYDDRSPLTFYVTPPPVASPQVWVEMVYAIQPADVISMDQDLDVLDVYQGPLIEYMIYRCLTVNAKSDQDRQAAKDHLGFFYMMLDAKDKATMLMTPNNPNNVMG